MLGDLEFSGDNRGKNMKSSFGLTEDFDVQVETAPPSLDVSKLEFTLHGEVNIVHEREGKILSDETGSNLITTSGKQSIAKFIIGQLDTDDILYTRIGLGNGGGTSVSADDTKLNNEYLIITDLPDTPETTTGTGDAAIVKDASASGAQNSGNATYARNLNLPFVASPATQLFYSTLETTTLTNDTIKWYGKYTFSGLGTVYSSTTNPSIVINEAGLINQAAANGNTARTGNGTGTNVILARRTFTDKSVKDNDTLTITWKITIK